MKTRSKILWIALGLFSMLPFPPSTVYAQSNAAPVMATDLQSGLVLYFDFDAPPEAGLVPDASGQHNAGHAVGVQWVADGHRGGAMQFGLTNGYITVADNISLNPEQYTLAAWVKTSCRDGVWRRIIDKGYGDYLMSMAGDMPKGQYLRGRAGFEAGSNWVSCKTTVADGQWHHCVGVFNGETLQFFLDGHPRDKVTRHGGFARFNYDLTIGANLHPATPADPEDTSFNGLIDDVMIYNRPLSSQEVRALYEAQGGVWADLPPATANPPSTKPSAADRLKQLGSLYEQGLINKDDYDRKKKEILDGI